MTPPSYDVLVALYICTTITGYESATVAKGTAKEKAAA